MANLLKHAELVREMSFRSRVQAAAVQAALNISGESTDPMDAKSLVRQNYALQVLRETGDLTAVFWSVAANGSILNAYVTGGVEAIPDGDIEFVISTVWDDVSGAARIPVYIPAPTQ